MKVPIIRIPFPERELDVIKSGVESVLRSGVLTSGRYTEEFESLLCGFTGAANAVACNSGTAAIELIVRGLGVEGRDVVVPTNTFMATALGPMHAGNRVVFADSDPKTLSLDVEDVRRRITPATAAVITVHVGGIVSPSVHELKALCDERSIYLIEDAAHAHGSSVDGQQAGTIGVAGAFSFFPTKVLTTGEGGAVVTDDDALAERMRMIRDQGKDPSLGGRIAELGHNYRMSELTAVMGVEQMHRARIIIDERRAIAALYDQALEGMEGFGRLVIPESVFSTYYKYVGYLDEGTDRAALKARMREKYEVALTGEVYADLCHAEPVWERRTYCGTSRDKAGDVCARWPACGCGEQQRGFRGAEYIAQHHVCLPLYPGISEDDVDHVVASLRKSLVEVREG